MKDQRTLLAVVLLLAGLAAIVVGVVYLGVEGHSLPSILGQKNGFTGHRWKRGVAALVVGVLLLIGGAVVVRQARSSSG